ncbi:MAG: hypothetical protein ACREA0_19410 [bacterium]
MQATRFRGAPRTRFESGWSGKKRLNEILRYDPAADAVVTLEAVLPSPRSGTSAVWDPRDRPSAGCPNGCAYVFGGYDGIAPDAGRLDEIVRFNPTTGTVTIPDARLPTPRWSTAAVWNGHTAYICGGDSCDPVCTQIVAYEPHSNEVSLMSAKLPSRWARSGVWDPRNRPAAGCGDGCLYLFGGASFTQTGAEIVQYNPRTDTATILDAPLPRSRAHTSAVWADTQGLVFGGGHWEAGSGLWALDDIVTYDPGGGWGCHGGLIQVLSCDLLSWRENPRR